MGIDFNNKVLFVWDMFGTDVWITESIFNSWIIMLALTAFAVIANHKIGKFTDEPTTRFQNFVELIVESMDNFVKENLGEKYEYFGNWFFGLAFFILACNLSALVGLRPPTTDLAVTASFAVTSFFLIHFMGLFTHKLGYFKEYIEPTPLFLPIHVIGELATPLSLSFRMFGVVLAGFIIMGLVHNLFPIFLLFGPPAILSMYFDIFDGVLQAFIFCILSLTFIKNKMPAEVEEGVSH